MTDAELIQRSQESEYTVADQQKTIENLAAEREEQEDHIEKLRGIVREGFLNEIRLTRSRNAWRRVAIIIYVAYALSATFWLIFTR